MSVAISVLTDRSKDASGWGLFGDQLPHTEFGRTTSTGPLSTKLLFGYQVLGICGQSLKAYSEAELDVIRAFVEGGGGLLLAADAGVFELAVGAPAQKLAQNRVAEMLGARFLDADCKGARVGDRLALRLPVADLVGTRHPALCIDGTELAAQDGACPIEVPEGADVLLRHKATGQVCAAAFQFGKGRVVMVGAKAFAHDRPLTCGAVARWLAQGAAERGEVEPVPAQVGPVSGLSEDPRVAIHYSAGCEKLVPEVRRAFAAVTAAIEERFGDLEGQERALTLLDSPAPHNPWGRGSSVGAQGSAGQRTARLAAALVAQSLVYSAHRRTLPPLFTTVPVVWHLTDKVLRDLGEVGEADRLSERADRWIAESGDSGRTYDLARSYEQTDEECPRGLVLLRKLEQEVGESALNKLASLMPGKPGGPHPDAAYVWPSDRGIYYLSLAAGRDLFPWFGERGITVHPVPMVKPEAKDWHARLWERLQQAMRDARESLSSRMDAALDLAGMKAKDKDAKLKHTAKDDWAALVDALVHARRADRRAAKLLGALVSGVKHDGVRAIAAVALADLGDAGAAQELVTLAKAADARFQLAAWYALEKAGSDLAAELSPERVGVTVEQEDRGFVTRHAMLDGHRVANNLSQPTRHPFTRHASVSAYEVRWVHTAAAWRRRGLSRYLFERSMAHPEAMECATSHLWTGTRNVAHALYREFGFIDMSVSGSWTCEQPGLVRTEVPTGVVFRSCTDGDRAKVDEFLAETTGKALCFYGVLTCDAGAGVQGFVALKGAKIVGYASARTYGRDEAELGILAAAQGDDRDRIADGLVSLVTAAAGRKGARRISRHNCNEGDYLARALGRAGYAYQRHGGVFMMQVRHLPQFLSEIAPALEARLADFEYKDWEGTVDLVGGRLTGRVTVSRGKVKGAKVAATPADVVLTASDDILTHVVLGQRTPFEAYLQTELTIGPRINERISGLVEVLFPMVGVW